MLNHLVVPDFVGFFQAAAPWILVSLIGALLGTAFIAWLFHDAVLPPPW